ncbi:protein mono-ADP-ribosyltransferase PARP14-like isoform X2 [Heterodontus francisci]|uniref:protein mono-ADP-ribosyltransferase PARP14-like isoform X2 n=1 Tax=Heterodontus francisci TaxID=7792 RepID=UPI00355C37D5
MSQGPFPILVEVSAASEGLEKSLRRYFSIRRKSGGGECQVNQLTETTFRVYFQERQAQQGVLQRGDHVVTVKSTDVKLNIQSIEDGVSEDSLQTQEPRDASVNLPGTNRAAEGAVPKRERSKKNAAYSEEVSSKDSSLPVTVVMVDPFFREYLNEREAVLRALQQELLGAQCKIQLGKAIDSILLIPTFDVMSREVSAEWGKGAERAFQRLQEQYLVCYEADPGKIQLAREQSRGALASVSVFSLSQPQGAAFVGLRKDVRCLTSSLESSTGRFEGGAELQNEAGPQGPAEFSLKLQSLSKFSLIRESFEEHLRTHCPGLTWRLDESCPSISITGSPGVARDALVKLDDCMDRVLEIPVRLSEQKRAFLRSWVPQELVTELFSFPIALELGESRLDLLGNSWPDLERATSILASQISEKVINVQEEARVATRAQEWLDMLVPFLSNSSKRVQALEVKDMNSDTSTVSLVGFTEEVEQAASTISEYLHRSALVEETFVPDRPVLVELVHKLMDLMDCRGFQSTISMQAKRAIVLKGPSTIVAAEKEHLRSCLASVVLESLEIVEPGAKEFFRGSGKEHLEAVARNSRCLVVLEEESPAADDEGVPPASPGSVVLSSYRTEGGVVVSVCRGDITQQQVDAIVNAVNGKLDHMGGVAKAISDAGGPVIQRESSALVARQGVVPVGQAVMTSAGRLPCRKVIHAVGPQWRMRATNGESWVKAVLRGSVTASLELAERDSLQSIAMPCLSSGIFGVPKAICADSIISAIKGFSGRSLRHITLIDINADVLTELQRACGQAWPSPGLSVQSLPDRGPPATALQWKIISGSIEEQESDVLVSPISHDMNVYSNPVCKAIFDRSPSLRVSVRQAQNVSPGQVKQLDVTHDPKLNCKYIYFILQNPWTALGNKVEESLRLGIRTCLELCDKASLSSITFPFFGTPRDVVARALLGEIQRFKQDNQLTSVKTVKIAIHPTDQTGEKILRETQKHQQEIRTDNTSDRIQDACYHSLSISTRLARVNIWTVVLEIVSGDITDEVTDIIVKSTCIPPPRYGKADLSNGNVVLTGPGKLKCKGIVHICGDDKTELIQRAVRNVLQMCITKSFQSVSFPTIGTGSGVLKPSSVAEVMIDTVAEMAQQLSQAQLRLVRIVLLDKSLFKTFTATLEKRNKEACIANQLKAASDSRGAGEMPGRHESDEEVTPAVINVLGRDGVCVQEALSRLRSICDTVFVARSLTYQRPTRLTPSEIVQLLQLARVHSVHVTVERECVRVRGEVGKLKEAVASVHCLLDGAACREYKEMFSMVCWFYRVSGRSLQSFDPEANYNLEQQHRSKFSEAVVRTLGYTFFVNLKKWEATVQETGELVKIYREERRAVK